MTYERSKEERSEGWKVRRMTEVKSKGWKVRREKVTKAENVKRFYFKKFSLLVKH